MTNQVNWRQVVETDLDWFITDQQQEARRNLISFAKKQLKRNYPNLYMVLIRHPNQL
jgi:hypothetical protein